MIDGSVVQFLTGRHRYSPSRVEDARILARPDETVGPSLSMSVRRTDRLT
jgi:hypothetical protein